MSDDLDPGLQALEDRLRAAHASLAPPPGLKERLRPRPTRTGFAPPWQGVAAAAAVLLAVAGVGYLVKSNTRVATTSGAGASQRYNMAVAAGGFGRLPQPFGAPATNLSGGGSAAAAPADTLTPLHGAAPAAPPLPPTLPVYRWDTSRPVPTACPLSPARALGGYSILGPLQCESYLPLTSAEYRLASPPAGAGLVYVGVIAGAFGFFEPAYQLPDGQVVTALTADELRP